MERAAHSPQHAARSAVAMPLNSPLSPLWSAVGVRIDVHCMDGTEEQIPKGKRGLDWKKLAARPRLFGKRVPCGITLLCSDRTPPHESIRSLACAMPCRALR